MKPIKQIIKDIPDRVGWVIGSVLFVADVVIIWLLFKLH